MKSTLNNSSKPSFTIPVIIITVFVVALGILLGIMRHNSISNQTQSNAFLVDKYSDLIERNLKVNVDFLNLLSNTLVNDNLPDSAFQGKVNDYLRSHQELINITWVDSNFTIKSVCPQAGNSHLIGLDIELKEPKRVSRLAKSTRQTVYSVPFEGLEGVSSFEAWDPVFKDNQFLGLFVAVYSSSKVIKTWIETDKYPTTYFHFLNRENQVITDLPSSHFGKDVLSQRKVLTSLDNGLTLEVTSEISSPFSPLIIGVISLLSFLLLGIIYSLWKLKHFQCLLQKKEILLIRQNEDLKLAKVKAEESDHLKSAFLANMSHEIRTPMNGILGFSSLLKEPDLSGELQQSYIEVIEKSGMRMLNIIDDIVSISKIESGLVEVDNVEFNVNELQSYLFTFFKPEVEAKNIAFSFNSSLPLDHAIIKTDKDKFLSILANLIKNAIKYTEKGSIQFGYQLKGEFLEFYVKDTGIGILDSKHKIVFKRFIQADIADKMARQGAGLGLSISKAYVELLGGNIWLESEQGKGSTFFFTIPYHFCPSKKEEQTKTTLDNELDSGFKVLTVLIVEDDENSGLLIRTLFEKIASNILQARDGVEAVELCKKYPNIDLILMDIRMPKMDGYEATRAIRQFNTEVVIIAQTAFALTGDREKALEAGCNEYITKPIVKEKLFALIKKLMKV